MSCKVVRTGRGHAIVCTRRHEACEVVRAWIVLVTRQGRELYCVASREEFEQMRPEEPVVVFDTEEMNTPVRRFFRSYLQFKREVSK